jgi:hypothetical protein
MEASELPRRRGAQWCPGSGARVERLGAKRCPSCGQEVTICRAEIRSGLYMRSRHLMRPLDFSIGVYLIHVRALVGSPEWKWTKVGSSRHLTMRASGLDAAHAGSKLLHMIQCPSEDAARGLESLIQAALVLRGRARRSRDYFRVEPEDVVWIRSMSGFEEAMLDVLKALR